MVFEDLIVLSQVIYSLALCPVPCKNGGECVNPTSNECRCPQGFQGQYCENGKLCLYILCTLLLTEGSASENTLQGGILFLNT
jgi:hypothetical protein